MSHRCEKCGDKFDTERGLHIHQSQKHNEEENSGKKTNGKEPENDKERVMELGVQEVALLFFAIGIGFGFTGGVLVPVQEGFLGQLGSAGDQKQEQALPIAEDTVDISNINSSGEPVLGEKDAPVTLVMYEDFQCPYCQKFESNGFQKIESEYVESGEVKVIWKDFPLPELGHNWAEESSAAMECVYRQNEDAFWEVKDKVFGNQRTLTENGVQSKIVSWAEQEGVSGDAVRTCLENGSPMEEVNTDKREGSNLEATLNGQRFVGGTPSFVVYGDSQGTALSGALPFQIFERVIDKELQDAS